MERFPESSVRQQEDVPELAKLQSLDPITPMSAQFREKETGPVILANTFFAPRKRAESAGSSPFRCTRERRTANS